MEPHPIAGFTTRLHQVLDEVLTSSAAGLSGRSAGETAALLAKAEARISALRLRLLDQAHREGVITAQQAVSEGWWAEAASVEHRRSRKDFRLARDLAGDFHRTETALAAGEVTAAQAEVIVDAVLALPASVGPDGREKAELHLLEQAGEFNPKQLRLLGRHLLDVIDPDAADERLAAQLEAEERNARRSCFLQIYADEHGTTHLRGAVPTSAGDHLLTALNAFASPRRPDPYARKDASGKQVANADLLGQAFVEMVQRYPNDRLPQSGGTNATILVTMSIETLLGGLESAELLTGHQLSPAEARRQACEAGIVPVVLGGESQPLDYGREKRFHTPAQRRLIFTRDKTCRAEGCEIPANWCHVHHEDPWLQGGPTCVDNGVTLCARHHTAAHDSRFTTGLAPDGRLRFTRIQI
jgi:hypothetical protein